RAQRDARRAHRFRRIRGPRERLDLLRLVDAASPVGDRRRARAGDLDGDQPAGGSAGEAVLVASAAAWWSRPRKVFAQALVPRSALSLITAGPSSMCSSSPYFLSRS